MFKRKQSGILTVTAFSVVEWEFFFSFFSVKCHYIGQWVEREELTVLTFSYATTYLWFLNRVLITFYFFKQFTHTDHSSKYVCFF